MKLGKEEKVEEEKEENLDQKSEMIEKMKKIEQTK